MSTKPSRVPKVRVIAGGVCDVPKPKGSELDHTAIWAVLRITHLGKSFDLVVIEASGMYKAPAEDVAKYLAACRDKYHAHLILTTESQEPNISRKVRARLGKGWAVWKRSEYIVAVDRSVLELAPNKPAPRIKRLTRTKGLVDWRNLFIGVYWLHLKPINLLILAMPGHTPAHVEMGTGWRHDDALSELQVVTWQTGLEHWGEFCDQHADYVLCLPAGDLNVNQKDEIWQRRVTKLLGAQTVWQHVPTPRRASHKDGRNIDAIAFRVGGKKAA